jgi:hypothetical protein
METTMADSQFNYVQNSFNVTGQNPADGMNSLSNNSNALVQTIQHPVQIKNNMSTLTSTDGVTPIISTYDTASLHNSAINIGVPIPMSNFQNASHNLPSQNIPATAHSLQPFQASEVYLITNLINIPSQLYIQLQRGHWMNNGQAGATGVILNCL